MAQEPVSSIAQTDPFSSIGLALSGGGYRAASFALGTLSYLNHLQYDGKGLNESIDFMSSASGGTITNLIYTSGIHKGEKFHEIYFRAMGALSGDQLLNQALTILNDDRQWGQPGEEKRRNIINAFARVYDTLFFKGETFGVYWDKTHVKAFEVCLNTTEFYRGLSFRFQTDGTENHYQWIGNNYLWFDTKKLATFKKIKLADVLASSSCFPAGFEPVVYPEDFTYAGKVQLTADELRGAVQYENYQEQKFPLDFTPPPGAEGDPKQKAFIRSFGLMDGGMTDNQGLSSLMKADLKRRKRKVPEPFGLMIVTDVSSYFMDHYEVPVVNPAAGWRDHTIGSYMKAYKSLLGKLSFLPWAAGILLAALLACCFIFPDYRVWVAAAFIGGISLAFGALAVFIKTSKQTKSLIDGAETFDIKVFLQKTLGMGKGFSDGIITRLSDYLKLTRLRFMEQMSKARLSSVLMMVSDINLKQVRRLIFEMFYDNACWENRRVPNFIYELSIHNTQARENRFMDPGRLTWTATPADQELLLKGLERIQPVAEEARLMGTTLWFDDGDQKAGKLRTLIATGQFTICMNLLEYLISLERKGITFNKATAVAVAKVRAQLEADLDRFKQDPYFMYDDLQKQQP